MDTAADAHQQLFDVAPPPSLPERILALAGDVARHNDLLADHRLDTPSHADQLTAPRTSAQRLVRHTRDLLHEVTATLPRHQTPARDIAARLRQLTHLTDSAAAQLDVLHRTLETTGAPATRSTAITVARALTRLGAEDLAVSAASVAHELRVRGIQDLSPQALLLSAAENDALSAVACGHVALTDPLGSPHIESRTPVAIATVRALTAQGLIESAPIPREYQYWQDQARVHLTGTGRAHLAGLASRPAGTTPPTARPLATVPATAPTPGPAAPRR
ncbi:hypothetical protein OG897_17140 [Streptomyces sp. NBC_00237]|uniref:hypothetical protein n=1 Tax=Streptomyces sp. NBC_00237 TaxID=2975687 RepID=UPI00224C862C|nr:hypothetical protein [Streptomyces sp. NBC_00237]MCX5203166.1 hypothetical protein [Streptomyces sp. NBC_00237]